MASVTITFEMLSKLSAGAKAELMALISGEMSAAPPNVGPVIVAPANELVLPDLLEVAEAPVPEAATVAPRASSPSRTVNNHYSADWSRLPFGPDGTVRIKTTYKGEELFGFCSGPKRFSDEAGVPVATSLNKFAQRLRGERAVDAWACCYYLDRDGSWKSMHSIRTRVAAETVTAPRLSHQAGAHYRLHPNYKENRAEVLAGTRQPPNTCAPWLGTSKKHRVEEGTVHFQIMAFLESRGGHATVAEIAAAVPTSEPIGDYLREMVYQGIIVQ
jgi:hypothetical protein